jgi:hypothetical protein
MGATCERTGCGRPGAAALALDPRRFVVWLGDLEGSAASATVLCSAHADTLTAPRGWERLDVRDAPRLFAVPSSPAAPSPSPAPPKRRRTRRRPAEPVVADPLPIDGPQPPPSSLGEIHQVDAALSSTTRALLHTEASTPLLARAFRGARATG